MRRETVALVLSAAAVVLAAALWISASQQAAAIQGQLKELKEQLFEANGQLAALRAQLSALSGDLARLSQEQRALARQVSILLNSTPPQQVPVKYATGFSILKDGQFYVLRDGLGRTILLAPRTADSEAVELYARRYRPDAVVRYPVEKAIYMSSTAVAMAYRLHAEGAADALRTIKGIMWGRQYAWHLPEVRAMLDNGTIADVGPASSPDYEKVVALKPDVVFVYFFPGPYGTEAVVQRLRALGVPYAVVQEFQEQTPLGRFEWVKFLAAFYNATDAALRLFARVEAAWDSVAAQARQMAYRPAVAWFNIFGGTLYPAGPQVMELIWEAGGRYAYANYSRVDLEVVLRRPDVDVLVWSLYGYNSTADVLKVEPRLKELRPLITGRAYAYSPAFYQLSNAYPERLIEELASIIHPEAFPPPPDGYRLFVQLR